MALTTTRTVLTRFDADASGQIKATKEIEAQNKRLMDSIKETHTSITDMFGSLDGAWAKSKRVYSDAMAVIEGFKDAHDKYITRTTQLGQLYSVSLDKLNTAAAGTRSQTQLLADAIALQTGVFKLNEDAISTVLLAERKLVREGADAEKVHAALTEALTKGSVDGLRPFGIAVDLAGASMADANGRAAVYSKTMDELKKLAGDTGLAHRTAAEEIKASAAKNTNSLDSIKNSVGGVVDALRPLTNVAADALGGLAELIDQVTDASRRQRAEALRARMEQRFKDQYNNASGSGKSEFDSREFGGWLARQTNYDPRVMQTIGIGGVFDQAASGRFNQADVIDKLSGSASGAAKVLSDAMAKITETLQGSGGGGGGYGGAGTIAAVDALQLRLAQLSSTANENSVGLSLGNATTLGGTNTLGSAAGYSDVKTSDLTAANSNALTASWKSDIAGYEKSGQTFMESTFGPIGQFNEYKAAWDGFTGAAVAGYNAMVTGTMGFGKAFKLAIAEALKATGAQMLIESLKEAAYAVGSLAIGNGPSAAAHFKSSALFAAGSIAAGVAARGLGAGGGGAAAGGGLGAGAGAAAPGPRPQNQNASAGQSIVYVVGDPFDTEANPRRRQNNAKRLLDEVGMRSSMGGSY